MAMASPNPNQSSEQKKGKKTRQEREEKEQEEDKQRSELISPHNTAGCLLPSADHIEHCYCNSWNMLSNISICW
ncbi:hypothetical protein R3I93_011178 [Phoxinus phoxinus]|uniref:Uncharacterized protein n=1 Tax=Phoxinus phoxinus TaxID=58324 RepID=A0AAN9CXD4_9TELE